MHAELQHTPSTQLRRTHSLGPVQANPGSRRPWQTEPWQYWPSRQLVSSTQLVGQLARLPVHKSGAHEGTPGLLFGEKVQVPSEPLTLHASQAAPQAVLQHTPSTH